MRSVLYWVFLLSILAVLLMGKPEEKDSTPLLPNQTENKPNTLLKADFESLRLDAPPTDGLGVE